MHKKARKMHVSINLRMIEMIVHHNEQVWRTLLIISLVNFVYGKNWPSISTRNFGLFVSPLRWFQSEMKPPMVSKIAGELRTARPMAILHNPNEIENKRVENIFEYFTNEQIFEI